MNKDKKWINDRLIVLTLSGVGVAVAFSDASIAIRMAGEAVAFVCAWLLGYTLGVQHK